MFNYVAKRILFIIPTLFGITTLSFVLINLSPGGPVEQKLRALTFGTASASGVTATAQGISPQTIADLNKQYGFDQSLAVRYLGWLKKMARIDFGKSSVFERPALDVILERAPVSLAYGGAAFFLTYLISIGLGLFMAAKRGGAWDAGLQFTLIAIAALPAFIFGVVLLVLFAGDRFLTLFPIGYLQSDDYANLNSYARVLDRVRHAILPLTCYVFGAVTAATQLQRNSVLSEQQKDYVRTARAKGIAESAILFKHILRNALLPLVTGLGGTLAVFVGGSVLVESVFQLNGLGQLTLLAVSSRDYNMIMALLVLSSALLLGGNVLGDFIYTLLDPRVRVTGRNA